MDPYPAEVCEGCVMGTFDRTGTRLARPRSTAALPSRIVSSKVASPNPCVLRSVTNGLSCACKCSEQAFMMPKDHVRSEVLGRELLGAC